MKFSTKQFKILVLEIITQGLNQLTQEKAIEESLKIGSNGIKICRKKEKLKILTIENMIHFAHKKNKT
jgi:hypothetical protein